MSRITRKTIGENIDDAIGAVNATVVSGPFDSKYYSRAIRAISHARTELLRAQIKLQEYEEQAAGEVVVWMNYDQESGAA